MPPPPPPKAGPARGPKGKPPTNTERRAPSTAQQKKQQQQAPTDPRASRAFRRLSAGSGSRPPAPGGDVVQSGRPESQRFWRACCDTAMFSAPFGVPVGDVPEGTVVHEVGRFVDCFDEFWIAANADDETVVWIRRFGAAGLTEAKVQEWEAVLDESSLDPTMDVSAMGELALDPCSPDSAVFTGDLWNLVQDIDVYEAFADTRGTAATPPTLPPQSHPPVAAADAPERDWNAEYQRAVEDQLYGSGDVSAKRAAMHKLVTAFADAVEDVVVTIVHEMSTPNNARQIPSHPSKVGIYFAHNIAFRVCVDTTGAYGGDVSAAKVASQLHRTAVALAGVAPKHLLHLPLAIMMTYYGYSVYACSVPPVRKAAIQYGSADSGKTRVTPSAAVEKMVEEFAKEINSKAHTVEVGGATTTIRLPIDTQIFLGSDGRFYLLNIARFFPPLGPSKYYCGYQPATSNLFQRLRPELAFTVDRPLSGDAFCPKASNVDDNREVLTMTQWLRDAGIPTLSAIFGFHEPFEHANLSDGVKCCGCQKVMKDELKFAVCAHDCCEICSTCFAEIMKTAHWENKEEEATSRVRACVKCGSSPRNLNSVLMVPDVTTVFHRYGVNLKYLAYVYSRLAVSVKPFVARFFEMELIARAAKNVVRKNLRVARDREEVVAVCVNFYLALLQSGGELAEQFWNDELGPTIQHDFGLAVPFDTAGLSTELVYRRVAELTGVELTEESIASFSSEAPFVQLRQPHPVMKQLCIPNFVDAAGEHLPYLEAHADAIQLLRNGPKCANWEDVCPKHLLSAEAKK